MQYNINVANGTGMEVRTNLNLAHQSLATNFFGATDPSLMSPVCAFPGSTWADTGNGLLKVRKADNSDWIVIGTIKSDGTPKLGENAINTSELALNLRQPSTEYAVGDIAYSALLPSWAYLECTVAGTTDSVNLPVPSSVNEHSTFYDGTVMWEVQSVTDKLSLSGGTMTGNITNTWINRSNSTGESIIYGGTGPTDGAIISLRGATNTTYGADQAGSFMLLAGNGNGPVLLGKTDGALTWKGTPVIYADYYTGWLSGNEWYEAFKWSDGRAEIRGRAIQAANVLGIQLNYPFPLISSVTAQVTVDAAVGTGYVGGASFTYSSTTVGYFTIKNLDGSTPTGPISCSFKVEGRWK